MSKEFFKIAEDHNSYTEIRVWELDEAIPVVEQWHRWQVEGSDEECLYTKLEAEKQARFEAAMEEMERLFGDPQEYNPEDAV